MGHGPCRKGLNRGMFSAWKMKARGVYDIKVDAIGCFFTGCVQSPAVSATKGTRHWAASLVAVVQKGIDGTAHDHNHTKNCLNRRIFCWECNSMWCQLDIRVDAIGCFWIKKSNAQEVKVSSFSWEHHLRDGGSRIVCLDLGCVASELLLSRWQRWRTHLPNLPWVTSQQ